MIYNWQRSTSFAVILLVLMMPPIGDGVQLVMVLKEMDRGEEDSRSWYMMQLDSPASAPA